MEIIKPLEIAGKIMTLFAEAKKFVIVVSPFYNFSYWEKLNSVIAKAKDRGVDINFFVREGEIKSIKEVTKIGYRPTEIKRLHAKIYFNEMDAIISSMNLDQSSDNHSLDIAIKTQNKQEYEEVYSFYENYIQKGSVHQENTTTPNIINNGKDEVQSHSVIHSISQHKEHLTEKSKKVIVNNNIPVNSVSENPPSFTDFLLNDVDINYLNWKESVVDFIKAKLKCKYARQYMKDNTMYFCTCILNFGCYFGNSGKKNYFMIKLDCNDEFYSIVNKNMELLIKETEANILTSDFQNNGKQVFINYEHELKSNDFSFINNDDLPTIIKTINCSLYILSSTNRFMNFQKEPKRIKV